MRVSISTAAAGLVLASLATLPAIAQEAAGLADGEWRVERLENTWPIAETAAVRVKNPRGSLWVRTHQRPEVYLLAHVQRHRDDPRELDLALARSDQELAVEADFTMVDAGSVTEPAEWAKRRIDLTVFVPTAAATRFSTDQGSIEVRGVRGPTSVETRTGDLRLRVHGAVAARTVNGDVLAQFLGTDWGRPAEIASTTGAIRVEMPRGGGAGVVVETRGEITSDFSTEIEWVDGSLLKRARLSVGAGGESLRLTSHQGAIKILQSLVSAEDATAEDDPR